jgi:carbonic anhydrase
MPVVGTRQSPIVLHRTEALILAEPQKLFSIEYKDQSYSGTFTGDKPTHGNFVLDEGKDLPAVTFRGNKYELNRIHIHFGAEHAIDPDPKKHERRIFEVHLVHTRPGQPIDTPKVAIGIIYHKSAKLTSRGGLESIDKMLQEISASSAISNSKKKPIPPTYFINPLLFFPSLPGGKQADLTNWFHYEGSLTSEPYSEDVSWFVMKTESRITPGQLKELEKHAEQEARHSYPLDSRIVVRSFKS